MPPVPGIEPFSDISGDPAVRGFLHHPAASAGASLVLTHGAGGNSRSPLLVALARAFAEAGFLVLRCDLPFRQARPKGSPYPATAAKDREGLHRALEAVRQLQPGRAFLGGQSYGGRQATMLAAEKPGLADGLLLLSYPLHPPGRPADLRVAHFPQLHTPLLFVHGSRDPFGSLEELRGALRLIPARTTLLEIEGAGHGLATAKSLNPELITRILEAFRSFFQEPAV
ncbi:MAG TPA: alpha/beta fold hydrolase [Terriglobales bacterium]|nr:alpha/beta fold hydrolase [Terriglobales bacterium]